MGLKWALIGAIIGFVIGEVLTYFIMSQIEKNFDPMSKAIFSYSGIILFTLFCAYVGYQKKGD
jgi:hypothetical protein